MIEIDEAFRRLAAAPFRRKFRLAGLERAYVETWGLPAVMKHGAKFIAERLAPAFPRNDGKQTPWRNHPIFVAQHATATCCRGCLEKVHEIAKGRALSEDESAYVLRVIERWLAEQVNSGHADAHQTALGHRSGR
ncbi:MAG: hypothetical protein QOF63_3385 [Thermoanaerobaculia bacterium]|nr:hypothetical protein [Thermoanaerobaculia bacterium]